TSLRAHQVTFKLLSTDFDNFITFSMVMEQTSTNICICERLCLCARALVCVCVCVCVCVQLFFKSRGILNEEGFILFVRKNAIIVLIPKFGLEGTVFFENK